MNTINEQTATLTKLIAEIDELDSDKQCLAVELDYLVKHLQRYKQTCEECVAMKKTHEEEDEEKAFRRAEEGGYEFPSNQLCRHCEEKPITRGESLCRSCFLSDVASDDDDEEDAEVCNDCGCDLKDKHYNDVYGNMVCDDCAEEDDKEDDDEEEEDEDE
jgi:hypothetical protein